MYLAKYLLSIEEFMEKEKGEALMERAFLCVDETRRRRAEGMRPGHARAASLGAGLLLQLAVREACAFEESGDRRPENRNMDSSMNGSANADRCGDMGGSADDDMRGVSRGMNGSEGAENCRGINGSADGTRQNNRCSRNGTMAEQKAADAMKKKTCMPDRNAVSREDAWVEHRKEGYMADVSWESGKEAKKDTTELFAEGTGRQDICTEREMRSGRKPGKYISNIKRYSVNKLLEILYDSPPVPLSYVYKQQGKPYFTDLPFYFNLSHSGGYVLCVLSTEEIGADIQRQEGKDVKKLAGKFYSPDEAAAIERAGEAGGAGEKLFYRLWARKEAYGKLTGRGVAAVLKEDLLPSRDAVLPERAGTSSRAEPFCDGRAILPGMTDLPDGSHLIWEECDMEDYSIAICRYG